MSETLATSPRLPGEAETVELRLADMIESGDVYISGYRVSESDRMRIVTALREADLVYKERFALGQSSKEG
jgi:hypothetical protein